MENSTVVFTRERLFMLLVCFRLFRHFIRESLFTLFINERLFMLLMCFRLFRLFIRESLFTLFTNERLFMLFKFTCTVYKS